MATALNLPVVPILGDVEVELQAFSPGERQEFLAGLGLTETGMARLVRESSRLLGLVSFYTKEQSNDYYCHSESSEESLFLSRRDSSLCCAPFRMTGLFIAS